MREKTKLLGYLVLIIGLFVIITGFFLFIPSYDRTDVHLLDLAVACWVFLVLAVTELGLMGFHSDVTGKIAGLGIRLISSRLYALLAIGIIAYGIHDSLVFTHQLFIQMVLILLLMISYFFTKVSEDKAASVKVEQDHNRISKTAIRDAISELESLTHQQLGQYALEQQKIEYLKEMVRYLSPTNNDRAIDMDMEAARLLGQAAVAIRNNQETPAVLALLNRCEDVLKLRKNTYSS